MLAHALARYAQGGLQGLQAAQRDYSPYVAHFTSYAAMAEIRSIVEDEGDHPVRNAVEVRRQLEAADEASLVVFRQIVEGGVLLANHPAGDKKVPKCLSLSECNLPSLISHAERYGRFGFVFNKETVFKLGGRPCAYLSEEYRALIRDRVLGDRDEGGGAGEPWGRLLALCHVFRPPGRGRIQNFAQEREWRLFEDLDIRCNQPEALLVPGLHIGEVRRLFPGVGQVISIDSLFDWGA